ncbi:hypothetical protein CROQUDRAFT_657853 [Cronartium quercuum f. sp. fusiforme G11]|uniref:Impact N-terminal domain-containing protein n=1 Tax=Cronartium quercuum f. sp. fusiforme G11 TaxID=708437 RepID=A0A9P6TBA5_9BASI|nr:hypothetical protein CROQUDRAFT_657853 [Cronartium quercuum f. sp. fusiforme G11]
MSSNKRQAEEIVDQDSIILPLKKKNQTLNESHHEILNSNLISSKNHHHHNKFFNINSSSSFKIQFKPIHMTSKIEDRDSYFMGLIFKSKNQLEVNQIKDSIKKTKHFHHNQPASHNIMAWRYLKLKKDRDGLSGADDYELEVGFDDDGEKWAGAKVLKVMESHQIIDAVVIVSRWYGGTLLGPVRFEHIETCARDACKVFQSVDALDDDLVRLKDLDDQVDRLRFELNSFNSPNQTPSNPSSSQINSNKYDYLKDPIIDLKASAKLITARQQTIAVLQKLINKAKSKESSLSTINTKLSNDV